MPARPPCAYNFYANECRAEQIERYLEGFCVPDTPPNVVAGIVPHAGWSFSGAVAAKVFKCIKEKNPPDTIILLSAIHRWGVRANSVYASGSWWTPFGDVQVDSETAAALLSELGGHLVQDSSAHSTEHSAEVQVPFIKYFFPQAQIVPIIILPDNRAEWIGFKIGETARTRQKKIVVVGTTDLTHYGPNYGFTPKGFGPEAHRWFKENDARIINLALQMKANEIVHEAATHHNACGAGAMAATVSAARAMGAQRGTLVEYTSSFERMPEDEFQMAVGYVGIIF